MAAAMVLVPAFALAPPIEGDLLLVPLRSDRSPADIAVRHGALIVAAGPTRGSLLVRGRLMSLAWPLLSKGVLTLGAPAVICGKEAAA
ncbi:hypothetical protein NF701_05490 [Sphingomonadaceae bacterium OTU29THOMA1]|nr:hypothetical protein NF699_06935 [Sphingomonadaceae bacterium OTU29LAMAA1]USU13287.1 hypothetical protein NF701_05490 [Sphingomonadaceae bacterium OTU29THOMA1]